MQNTGIWFYYKHSYVVYLIYGKEHMYRMAFNIKFFHKTNTRAVIKKPGLHKILFSPVDS